MFARTIVRLSSLAMLLITLVACSAAPTTAPSAAPTPPPAGPSAPPAAPTLAPAPAGDDWTRVQASGVLRVGSPLDNPPFNLYTADFQPDGFDVALMNAIAEELGLKAEFNDLAFDGLLGALQLDRVDAVIAAMAITEDREAIADFTSAYYQGEDVILAAADSPITAVATRADLAQRRIGVQRGTVYESWLLKNMVETGEMPVGNLLAYSQPVDAVAGLDGGRVDLVIMDREPGLALAAQAKAKVVGKSLYTQDYAIALRKGSTLAPHLNQALARALADGTVARLTEQYLQLPPDQFTPVPPPPTAEPQPVEAATIAPPTLGPTPTPASINDMAWVQDLSYDDAHGVPVVQPGQAIRKGWRIRNSGTTTWSADYRFAYADGNTPASNMGGQPVLIGKAVAPGQETDVYVDMVAPQAPGVYQGFWEMKNAANKAFGEQVWVKVQIPAPKPAPTDTPAPGIAFWADKNQLAANECTYLHWKVTGIQAVYLCPPGQGCRGVAGEASEKTCPAPGTTTYELRVEKTDRSVESQYQTIQVAAPVNAASIVSFDADPLTIQPGGWVNLWWRVQGNAGRTALLRNGSLLQDRIPGDSTRDQPPGSGQQVVYELQVWPAGRDTGEPDKRQRAVMIEAAPPPPQPQTVQLYKDSCMSSQTLRTGDVLRITLEAIGGTGFVWRESPDYDGSVLLSWGEPGIGSGSAPGSAAVYTFSYTASRGQTTLSLLLIPPSGDAASATDFCAVTVTVQ